ncbi:proline and serine-rich protein 3 isoform X2 [Eublepharis macularius]|uniref:Proline and serine-rich protein 3 isoform X2 n=1 Tax=Eublepharis macularius TaxID=481883 RepID=A0AA97KED9_EUBMA|nr:proline and serine-rich protein 3 isoform X2 [Eublepharis macularius]
MESSTAVFSNLGSPFLEASSFQSQSHYHPSQAQPLSQRERSTALSPSRLQQKNHPTFSEDTKASSPPLPSFLPDSSCQVANPPNSDSASPFNESWPSTERSSSSLTPEGPKALPPEQTSGSKALAFPKLQDSFSDSESIIARYIERFRYGQPTNRRERWRPDSHSSPFWWFGQSSPEGDTSKMEMSASSGANRKDVDTFVRTDSGQREGRVSSFSPALDQSPSGESLNSSTLDPDTVSLQERAARLLHRSTSPLSSCRHISSEGLSSTPTSTITSADADQMGQASKQPVGHQRKEDDILFQWRLRRKMEEASKAVAVLPSVGWRSQFTEPAYPPSVMGRAGWKSPEPVSWRSKDRTELLTSEAQLGPTLDEHPCCCTERLRNGSASQQPREGAPFSDQNVMAGRFELNREQTVKKSVPQEDPAPAHLDFLPPPRPAGATKSLHQIPSDHSPRTAPPVQKVCTEPREKQRTFKSERGRPKPAKDSAKPSVSPVKHVQRVLGEVVAERLFSSPESPVRQRGKLKKSSKKQDLKESLPDTVATPSYPKLLNMAAQLLEQAEDSDGTDFEDDPLLQVLRSQRDFLRSQLRAVDMRMAQLEGHHSTLDFSHP